MCRLAHAILATTAQRHAPTLTMVCSSGRGRSRGLHDGMGGAVTPQPADRLGHDPLPKERQDEFGQVVGGAIVGVVGPGTPASSPSGDEPGGDLGPGHRHDRLPAAPRDQYRHRHEGSFAFDRVPQGMVVAEIANPSGNGRNRHRQAAVHKILASSARSPATNQRGTPAPPRAALAGRRVRAGRPLARTRPACA